MIDLRRTTRVECVIARSGHRSLDTPPLPYYSPGHLYCVRDQIPHLRVGLTRSVRMARIAQTNSDDSRVDALSASMPRLDRQPEPYQVLDADGNIVGQVPDLSDEQLISLYRWMLFGRQLDERAWQLQ